MKAVIPIESSKQASCLSEKFARSKYFAIVDKVDKSIEIIENPFVEIKIGVGKKLVNWLVAEHQIDTLIAFELGLKVQQLANQMQLQLIIINEKKQQLKNLLAYMGITKSLSN